MMLNRAGFAADLDAGEEDLNQRIVVAVPPEDGPAWGRGVLLESVRKSFLGTRLGLADGDVLLGIFSKEIESSSIWETLNSRRDGPPFCLSILRNGCPIMLGYTLTPEGEEEGVLAAGDAESVIQDPALDQAVRRVLLLPDGPVYASYLIPLNDLTAPKSGIADLKGIEHAVNLTSLRLSGNAISDLSPLAGLRHLTRLHLDDNSIDDVTVLSGLKELEALDLGNNRITDIEALSGLTSLKALFLGTEMRLDPRPAVRPPTRPVRPAMPVDPERVPNRNRIKDLAPLSALKGLDRLGLGGNDIADIVPLAGLTEHEAVGIEQQRDHGRRPPASVLRISKRWTCVSMISKTWALLWNWWQSQHLFVRNHAAHDELAR